MKISLLAGAFDGVVAAEIATAADVTVVVDVVTTVDDVLDAAVEIAAADDECLISSDKASIGELIISL